MGMEQLHSGEIYYPTDDSIMEVQFKCLDKLYDFNASVRQNWIREWQL